MKFKVTKEELNKNLYLPNGDFRDMQLVQEIILEGEPVEEECGCKEGSCKKDCSKPHTHKGFFCEVCEPEATSKMNEPQPIEEIEHSDRWIRMTDYDRACRLQEKLNEVIKAINKK